MKRPFLITLMAVLLSLVGSAQRVSTHSGFASHPGGSFHGGMTAAPARMGAPRFRGFSPSANQRPVQRSGPPRLSASRGPYAGPAHHRRPYRPPFRRRGPYVYGPLYAGPILNGWISPYAPDYLDYAATDTGASGDQGYDQTGSTAYADQGPYAAGTTDQLPPWPSDTSPARSAGPVRDPAPETAVTLIFRDGRASEQIHNYLLTRTTLAILDQRRREIPLDEIDLAATARVNREAGVDFSLPLASSERQTP